MSKKKAKKEKVSETENSVAVASPETSELSAHGSMGEPYLAKVVGEPQEIVVGEPQPDSGAEVEREQAGVQELPVVEQGSAFLGIEDAEDVDAEDVEDDEDDEFEDDVEDDPAEEAEAKALGSKSAHAQDAVPEKAREVDPNETLMRITKLQEAIRKATKAVATASKPPRVVNPRPNVVYVLKNRPPNWCNTPQVQCILDVIYSQNGQTEFTEPELYAIIKAAGEDGRIRTRQAGGAWHIFSYYLADMIKHNVLVRH